MAGYIRTTATTTTTTVFTATETHLVTTLSGEKKVPREFNCQNEIDEVSDIIWQHKDLQDPLSKNIKRWGVSLFKLRDIPKEELLAAAIQKINDLQEEVLIFAVIPSHPPLTIPVMERQWTWEKRALEQYLLEGKTISPFDGQPMEILSINEYKIHPLAAKMIEWVANLPRYTNQPASNNTPSNRSLVQIVSETTVYAQPMDAYTQALAAFVCNKSARTYAAVTNLRDTREESEKTNELAEKLTEQTKKMCAEAAEELKGTMKNHEKKLDERIENIEVNHQGEVNVLTGQVNDFAAKLTDLKEDHEELKKEKDAIKEENGSMRRTIASLQQQVNSIPRDGGGGGCTVF